MKKHIIFCTLLAIVAILCSTACSSSKNASANNYASGNKEGWTTAYIPVKVSMDKPMSMAFSGRATMLRNEEIYVSMRFLTMEVALLRITTDSVFFVDKFHKYLFAEPLATILGTQYSNITVGTIQDILLGQTPVPVNSHVTVETSGPIETPAGTAYSTIAIQAQTPKADVAGAIEWDFKSAKWNEPDRTTTFKMPKGYKRITLDGVQSMLRSFKF